MADKIIGLRPDGTLNPETIAAVKEIAGAGAGSVVVTDDGAGTYTVGGTPIKGLTPQGQLPGPAKKYVDDALSGKANTTHSHAWGEVTGKPTTFAPAPHTHTAADIVGFISAGQLPWANSTDAGIIDPVVFSKIVGATQWNVGGSLVQRSAEGNAKFSDPVTADDAATKNYVDTGLNTKAPTAHTHPWADITGKPTTFTPETHTHAAADITTGTLAPARLPAATTSAQGAMPAADKSKLDAAVSAATASRLVIRDTAGRAQFATPAATADAATKGYVDTGLTGKADATHTHDDRYYTEAEVNALLANRPPVLILGPTDPIPAGTPDGTLVARTA